MSTGLLWVVLSLLGASPGTAPPPSARGPFPWANVTPTDEAKATALRDLGNQELYEGLTDEAAEHYRQALEHWDHPAIHYNYAQALLKLFKMLECHDHLEAATRYGAEPLGDEEKFKNAIQMLTRVEGELTRLEITCEEPGARVSMDEEKDQLECPRTVVRWMPPGPHVLSISKPELVSRKKAVHLSKGKRVKVLFEIFTEQQMKRSKTRWAWWLPWTVIGGGAALLGGGAGLHVHGVNTLADYDQGIAGCAASRTDPGFSGCPPDKGQEWAPLRSQGYTEQGVAWGTYLVGGVAVLTGFTLLGLNLPETYLEDPELDLRTASVTPVVGPGLGGVRLSIAF